jgi:hypothetical protein
MATSAKDDTGSSRRGRGNRDNKIDQRDCLVKRETGLMDKLKNFFFSEKVRVGKRNRI